MSNHRPQPADHHLLLGNIRELLNQGRKQAMQAVNSAMVQTYWEIGRLHLLKQQGKPQC